MFAHLFRGGGAAVVIASVSVVLASSFPGRVQAQQLSASADAADAQPPAAQLTPRGEWAADVEYARNDLVASRGSSWLALRASIGKPPGQTKPSTATDWGLFAGGFNPLGPWDRTVVYQPGDLVIFQGSTWLALATNRRLAPANNPADWDEFAARGDRGAAGATGPAGPQGPQGNTGPKGDTGAQGATGARGPAGPQGPIGLAGPQGPVGSIAAAGQGSVSRPSIRFKGDAGTGIFSPAAGQIALAEGGALFMHNIGTGNTALGATALINNTGTDNTAIGTNALVANTTGELNTAVGFSALSQTTEFGFNTAVGGSALANATGSLNTAVGSNTMDQGTGGFNNVAIGAQSLRANTGTDNVAVGVLAMVTNTIGGENAAMGRSALQNLTTGGFNTAVGTSAAANTTTPSNNVAIGADALIGNTTGAFNVAVGTSALAANNGDLNVALGEEAGTSARTSSSSIFIGNFGSSTDTATIKIGRSGIQTTAFIFGIRGVTTGVANAVPVLIDSNGQLGTASSSRRYKEDIHAMADPSAVLMKLRPVTFRYKKPYADGSKPLQYGLIAEEVAETMPHLAVFNEHGQPETVKYHELPTFLLAAYQRDHRLVQAQQQLIHAQTEAIAALQRRLARLEKHNIHQRGQTLSRWRKLHRTHVAGVRLD